MADSEALLDRWNHGFRRIKWLQTRKTVNFCRSKLLILGVLWKYTERNKLSEGSWDDNEQYPIADFKL